MVRILTPDSSRDPSEVGAAISLAENVEKTPDQKSGVRHTDTWLVATFPQLISIHVMVSAARAPIDVASDGASAILVPRHHDEHSGQDEGTGQNQGRVWQTNGQQIRVLSGRHLRFFTANHGQPKPLLKALFCPYHVVPKF
jgi:hypothetical protein